MTFTDEKKWNLDAPDNFSQYWHDLRKGPQQKFSKQQGGDSTMVLVAIYFNVQVPLAFFR